MHRILATFLFLIVGTVQAAAWTHGQPTPPYVGNVATRIFVPNEFDNTTTQAMSRTGHYARSNITSLKIAAPNFDDQGTVPGTTATVTASIEYPQGVCTQIKFSGSTSGTITNNSFLLSDSVSVTIPNGALFWVRQFWQGANGTPAAQNHSDPSGVGDAFRTAASGLSDQTLSCTAVTNSVPGNTLPPVAIVASTTAPSVCIVGDSIAFGQGDSYSGSSGDIGGVDRSIGPPFAYADFSIPGDTAAHFSTSPQPVVNTLINTYCSHVVSEYGSNDIYLLGSSVATLQSDLTTTYGLFPGKTIFQTTITPRTTSTDSWATLGNQTIVSGNAARVTFNDALRAGSFGSNGGQFDMTSAVESSLDSGKWGVNICTPPTADGIHPSACNYLQIQSSGVFVTSRIHYP